MLPRRLLQMLGRETAHFQERPHSPENARLTDWLVLNALPYDVVRNLVVRIQGHKGLSSHEPLQRHHAGLTAQRAWQLCASSLRAAFPTASAVIDDVEKNTLKCLHPRPEKHTNPFTFDLGPRQLPFVSVHYNGTAADLLALAHEFGHAVQIAASHRLHEKQMQPVARECCAFLAELAILRSNETSVHGLKQSHAADDQIYFGAHLRALDNAMDRRDSPYRYFWNYPIARALASMMFERRPRLAADLYSEGSNGAVAIAKLAAAICEHSQPSNPMKDLVTL